MLLFNIFILLNNNIKKLFILNIKINIFNIIFNYKKRKKKFIKIITKLKKINFIIINNYINY